MSEAARQFTANDQEPCSDPGPEPRLSVLLSCEVQSGHNLIRGRLREVSRSGAWIDAAALPPVGSIVRFRRDSIEVSARVVRIGLARFELQFRELIEERELLIAIGGRKPKAPSPAKAIFPADNYLGLVDFDKAGGRDLPVSKH